MATPPKHSQIAWLMWKRLDIFNNIPDQKINPNYCYITSVSLTEVAWINILPYAV